MPPCTLTNPRARIRPIHRPPRLPADREPHCHWTIIIDPENEPVGPARLSRQIAQLPLASLSIEPRPPGDGYQRELDTKFRLADCSDSTLAAVTREFSVQNHLLMASAEVALAERFGVAWARHALAEAWLATAWVGSVRLRDVLGDEVDLATVLALHPAIPPGFTRSIEVRDEHVHCTLVPESPALLDTDQPGWIGSLVRGETAGIQGVVQPIDDRARVEGVRIEGGAVAIDVHVDPNAEPAPEPRVVAFMRIGMLSRWKFAL